MNHKILEIACYIRSKLSDGNYYSPSRILGMIFLSDWRHAIITHGKPITNYPWSSDFPIQRLGEESEVFANCETHVKQKSSLSKSEKAAIDYIIQTTQDMDSHEFSKLLYSTFPMIRDYGGANFNMRDLAQEYTSSSDLALNTH